jgi:hypothetical protein
VGGAEIEHNPPTVSLVPKSGISWGLQKLTPDPRGFRAHDERSRSSPRFQILESVQQAKGVLSHRNTVLQNSRSFNDAVATATT